jgi:HD-GYP domain-containing protein (c-di-GMP phosphodiesterase class II)
MINIEEKLIQELSSAYEQLALFYDWNQEISSKKNQLGFTDILGRLTCATSSELGVAVSMGRGRSLNVLASYNGDSQNTDEAVKRFKDALPDIETKLHWNYAIPLDPIPGFQKFMVVVPWRSESILKGAFLYTKQMEHTKQETLLLANASSEIISMIEQSTLTKKLQDKNNEMALYLVKDLGELREILKNLAEMNAFNHEMLKTCVPEDSSAYHTMMGVIKSSTDKSSIGKLVEHVFPSEVSVAIMEHKESNFSIDTKSYTIRLSDPDEPSLGSLVVSTPNGRPAEFANTILNSFKKLIESALSIEQSNSAIQRLYNSHLLSMSKLVDTMHPLLSARNDNAMYVIKILSKALELTDSQREALEMATMLSDISLIYLDKRSLEEYLVKGTMISGPEALKKIREHPTKSADMISPVKSLGECIEIIKWHHERWDGYGYPDGLKGDEIPLLARVLSVVQGLTSRSIHHYMSVDDLLSNPIEIDWLKRQSGKAYDPSIVQVLMRAVGIA